MLLEALPEGKIDDLLVPREERVPYPRVSQRQAWENLDDRESLIAEGCVALQGYPQLSATAYLKYASHGDRRTYEEPYFKRRSLLIRAVLAECAEDKGTFLNAIIDGIWAICEESTWVIPAHNGAANGLPGHEKWTPLPDVRTQGLDLFAAQTGATLAYAVFLLGERLDAVTPMVRNRVQLALEKRIFTPFMQRDDFWWMGFVRKNLNNWTPWILSNVMDSFLLAEEDDARIAAALTRALAMLDRYLVSQPEDGGCDEGVAYWNMAGASLLDCLETLRVATGGALDYYHDPLVRNIATFPVKAHVSGEWFLNFADCDAKPLLDGERLYTFGIRTQNTAMMALGNEICKRTGYQPMRDTPQMRRVMDALFTRRNPVGVAQKRDGSLSLPALQLYALERNGFYAAIKGGNNGESHNHNDVGSVVIYCDGKPVFVDAGNMVYTAKTFSSERYTLWNTRAAYHNLPLIGGVEQQAGAQYKTDQIAADGNMVTMELQAAYPPEAGLLGYRRTLVVTEEVKIEDEIQLKQAAQVCWIWMAREKPVILEKDETGQVHLGKVILLFDSALSFDFEEIPVTDARMARSYEGSLYRIFLSAKTARKHHYHFILQRG